MNKKQPFYVDVVWELCEAHKKYYGVEINKVDVEEMAWDCLKRPSSLPLFFREYVRNKPVGGNDVCDYFKRAII